METLNNLRTVKLWLRTENLDYWGYENPNPKEELTRAMKSLSFEVNRTVTFVEDVVTTDDKDEYALYVKTNATDKELDIMEDTLTLSGWYA